MKEEKPMKIHNRIHKYKAEYYLGNKKITKKEYETSQNIIDLQAENTKLKQEKEELLKYKNAWEELKTKTGQFDVMQNGFGGCCIHNDLDDLMQELEQKH